MMKKIKDDTFKEVLGRVKESDLLIPWYEKSANIEKGVPDYLIENHVPIRVNSVIEALEAKLKIAIEALDFYAEEGTSCSGGSDCTDYATKILKRIGEINE